MAINKYVELRFLTLDRCFSDFNRKYTVDDLLEIVNDKLYNVHGDEYTIMMRQLRDDIKSIRQMLPDDVFLDPIPLEGRKCYYRYSKRNFSIYNNELSISEVQSLRSTIEMLGKYRSLPSNDWLEEVISNLEYRFGVKANAENIVSFDQNELLKGIEFLGELIDSAMNHHPISVLYRTFAGIESHVIIHPYHLKQFNNRWFLIGLQEGNNGNYITNKALDRIVKVSRANVSFIPNDNIDFKEYFNDVLGVTIPEEHPEVENVILRFDSARFPYVVNKPIHPSQLVLDNEQCTIQLSIRPNKELEARIFSYGNQVEVLKPSWLRAQIINKYKEILKIYTSVQNSCTDNM